jgi:hypothetical protein
MGDVFRIPTIIGAAKATAPAIARVIFLFEFRLSATIFAIITSYLEFDTGTQPIVSRGDPVQGDGIKKDGVLDKRRC